MSIVTKTGDKGKTKLYSGESVEKHDIRIQAVGAIDELNSILGICRSQETVEFRKNQIKKVQSLNFVLCAEVATTQTKSTNLKERITDGHIRHIEDWIAQLENHPDIFKDWAVPGNYLLAAYYDQARCVCRRAEREISSIKRQELLQNLSILKWINRLSDWLWLIERTIEIEEVNSESSQLRKNKKDTLEQ